MTSWTTRQWWSAADIAKALGKKKRTVYYHLRVLRTRGAMPHGFPLTPSEAQNLANFMDCRQRNKK